MCANGASALPAAMTAKWVALLLLFASTASVLGKAMQQHFFFCPLQVFLFFFHNAASRISFMCHGPDSGNLQLKWRLRGWSLTGRQGVLISTTQVHFALGELFSTNTTDKQQKKNERETERERMTE